MIYVPFSCFSEANYSYYYFCFFCFFSPFFHLDFCSLKLLLVLQIKEKSTLVNPIQLLIIHHETLKFYIRLDNLHGFFFLRTDLRSRSHLLNIDILYIIQFTRHFAIRLLGEPLLVYRIFSQPQRYTDIYISINIVSTLLEY